MTGFAAAKGTDGGAYSWAWEIRSVNAKGLDLRLRVPDWIEGLEAGLRKRISAAVQRGNVTLSLRISRSEEAGTLAINAAQLSSVLEAMAEIEHEAMERGLSLAPANAADIVGLRGVLEPAKSDDDSAALLKILAKDFDAVLNSFIDMRAYEGRALHRVLLDQLTEIETLTAAAASAAKARAPEAAKALKVNLAAVMDNTEGADPARVAQELALLAVKSDVTEEIDRLTAHVDAARALLAQSGPVGRKLDFLTQEFNREANTLCSKAGAVELTRIGLDLKAVIDRLREQVQNME
ncbi:YicC family protein [Litorivita pollutaquae]|uniref:YicC family protein n=1 Tax=Litorivita pollutaquae TaxID=2200892 RepID=A0A2V4N325_9RHOB|nr:YicC/YloC family endoribonuclease [Litorivita pollutaquae]OUS21842.1 YicC family protein [Rhodobacterales bacterium 59_46_T64]PYC48312.1 YicC family protein [Litorivita pollutaquae]